MRSILIVQQVISSRSAVVGVEEAAAEANELTLIPTFFSLWRRVGVAEVGGCLLD